VDTKVTLYPFPGFEVEVVKVGSQGWAPVMGRQRLGDWGLWTASALQPQGERVYWHSDRLGSPAAKSGSTGVTLERHGFNAWGSGRTDSWAPRPYGRLGSTHSPRGFTGHEHLDAVGGLIHMNGRAYDPNLGRFLSVDPVIQFPANSQSLNPYSYILNNPMAGTDPTGYCSAPVGSKIKTCDVKITQVSSDGSQRTEKYNSRNDADMASAASSVAAAGGQMIESGAPKAGAIPASKGGNNVSQAEGSTTGAAASETIGSPAGSKNLMWAAPTPWQGVPYKKYATEPDLNGNRETSFWNRMIDIDDSGDDVFISINMGIRGATHSDRQKLNDASSDISSNLNGKYRIGDRNYHLWVNLYPTSSQINSIDLRFISKLELAGQARVGGRYIEVGSSTRGGTYAHEFLHAIGFGHLPNWTGGMRSFAPYRSMTPYEVSEIYDMYK
jgi:RHS repeat-associated protein